MRIAAPPRDQRRSVSVSHAAPEGSSPSHGSSRMTTSAGGSREHDAQAKRLTIAARQLANRPAICRRHTEQRRPPPRAVIRGGSVISPPK